MHLTAIFDSTIVLLVNFISQIGYVGIFIGMFLESTMFPLPSELIMIPAGMSVSYGHMDISMVIIAGVLGNLFGAIFSYYLASMLGRPIILKIGKYFFMKPEVIAKIEVFFEKHGTMSVFIGRLIPGVRHFISLPAGLAKMNFKTFCIYTTLGSTIWTAILAFLGLAIGTNKTLIKQYLHIIAIATLCICALALVIYIYVHKRKSRGFIED